MTNTAKEHGERIAEREARNNPWGEPPKGKSTYVARCPFPHRGDTVHNYIRRELCKVAGGYSEYDGYGAWLDGAGKVIGEPHTLYEVVFPAHALQNILSVFRDAGKAQGEQVTLVTVISPSGAQVFEMQTA